MKKTFLTIAAALLMCVPTFAQQQQKVDVEGLLKKIEKSDATIANEKKATKASNWVKRAEIMMEAETAYTSNIYETMEANMVLMLLGNPATQEQAEVAGNPYLIDLELLVEAGLLKEAELTGIHWSDSDIKVDFGKQYEKIDDTAPENQIDQRYQNCDRGQCDNCFHWNCSFRYDSHQL